MKYKYGEMDSAEEINKKAAELKAAGDREGVGILAKENGIDKDMADAFWDGYVDLICDIQTAAAGKLDVEIAEYSKMYVANAMEVAEALKSLTMQEKVVYSIHKAGVDMDIDCTGEELAAAIRQKRKSLNDICAKVFKKAGEIHASGTPASAMVVPMVIYEYITAEKEIKKKGDKKNGK